MIESLLLNDGSRFGEQEIVASPDVGQNTVQIANGAYTVDNYRMWIMSGTTSRGGTLTRALSRCTFTNDSITWVRMGDYPTYIAAGPCAFMIASESRYWATKNAVSALYNVGSDTWTRLTDITDPKMMSTSSAGHNYRGSIYRVFRPAQGGNAVVTRYDPLVDAHALLYEFDKHFGDQIATCHIGSRIYLFPSNDVVGGSTEWGYFNLERPNDWVSCGTFPRGSAAMHCVPDTDKIHIFGAGTNFDEVYTVHLRDNYVLKRPNLIRPCSNTPIIVVDNKAMLWGGTSNNTTGTVGYKDFLSYYLDPRGGYFNR